MFQVINFKEDLVMQILKAIWDFFQNQILGMRWLNELVGNGLSALGLIQLTAGLEAFSFCL